MDQCSKLQDHQSVNNGVHSSTPLPNSFRCPFQLKANDVDQEVQSADFLFNNVEVEVGSVYEIDHLHLPPRTPVQLRSIRVAMVSEKTELNVAMRFPSMESLKTYFSNSIREMYPALDEKFVMGTVLAAKVLLRQIPSQEFAENKHLEGFWLVNAAAVNVSEEDNSYRNGNCLTELKGMGMVRWGTRRQVKFLERHKENMSGNLRSPSSFRTGGKKAIEVIRKPAEAKDEDDNDVNDDDDDDRDDDDDNKEDDEKDEQEEREEDDGDDDEREDDVADVANEETEAEEETQEMNRNLKRKRYKLRNGTTRQKAKKVEREKKKKKLKKTHARRGRNKCRELLVMENPKDRWSAERYQLATKNLLEVMKAKGATAGNPILRPDLRAEARKKIGDTGLLDHLLKHMAGKLAPGGEERFRRRHNADGAMEYWLESADLVKIRKDAGVNDPYWIPPPGWKPGDCPTQDPICAKELRLLKEEISHLKRNALEMVPRKQLEEEVGKLRREIDKLVSNKKQGVNQAIGFSSNQCDISEKFDQLANSLVSSKSHLTELPVSLEKYKDQLIVIQDFARGIEEEIKKLMPEAKGGARSNTELIVSKESGTAGKEIVELEKGTKEQEVQVVVNVGELEGSAKAENAAAAEAATAEKKAAKIERLKSGFRICKPQGTFLWPNMARNICNNTATGSTTSHNMVSPRVVVQVEDLLVVPTPPSVSSSTAVAPPLLPYYHTTNTNNHHQPTSPVKPLAERRAVKVTVSTLSNDHGDHSDSSTVTTTTTANKKTTPINLNDVPYNSVEVLSGLPSSLPRPAATSTLMPQLLPDEGKKETSRPWEVMTGGVGCGNNAASETTGHLQKQPTKCCSSSASCLSPEKAMGNWLALATANSASDQSSQG
ncbi:protein DYAD-like [Coffea arabica]|uniref:Protein DYAD-like n=1 Tax=Coffea arabica TaxID=13443 RepID=A0ABM4X0R2_COFAR